MDIRHIMAQLGISQMKFAIYTIQTFLADYKRLPFIKRTRRTHEFITKELPIILEIMIKEERNHANTPFD